MNACEGQARGIGFVKIEHWSGGSSAEYNEIPFVSLGEQVQGCDDCLSFICQ